jgi:hypothetical protein
MKDQGDEGMKTELTAFTRMLSGNTEYKAWARKNRAPTPGNSKRQRKQSEMLEKD